MDVTKMTDVQELKAAAYDQMVLLEQIQHNLAVITARIAELTGEPAAAAQQAPTKQ
jgi:hypothetical protein